MPRLLILLSLLVLVAACTSVAHVSTQPHVEEERALEVWPIPVRQPREDGEFQSLEALLDFRSQACARSGEEREALLQRFRNDDSPEATMGSLMLATCEPDQTPGLLANSLLAARELEDTPAGFDDLLDLLSAQARAYALVEKQLRRTRRQLDDMVEGIRNIEAEMGEPEEEDEMP